MQDNIKNLITEYVLEYSPNSFPASIWQKPLIAFIKADDKRFKILKQTVSPPHIIPVDLLLDAKSVAENV